MKKFLNIFFVILGVIFFVIILVGFYLYFADPFEIRPLLKMMSGSESVIENTNQDNENNTTSSGNANLSDSQKKALETFGIDPASIPSQFTPEQLTCFEGILGVERVAEIKAGASPSATEFFKARSCL